MFPKINLAPAPSPVAYDQQQQANKTRYHINDYQKYVSPLSTASKLFVDQNSTLSGQYISKALVQDKSHEQQQKVMRITRLLAPDDSETGKQHDATKPPHSRRSRRPPLGGSLDRATTNYLRDQKANNHAIVASQIQSNLAAATTTTTLRLQIPSPRRTPTASDDELLTSPSISRDNNGFVHLIDLKFDSNNKQKQREQGYLSLSREMTTASSLSLYTSTTGGFTQDLGSSSRSRRSKVPLPMTIRMPAAALIPTNKARVQRDYLKRALQAVAEQPNQQPKIQRMRKIGVVLPCPNYLDREEENEVKFGIKSICDSSTPVMMTIVGNSGCGKTSILASLLNEERYEVFLWYECRAEVIAWLNVLEASKAFDEETFVNEIFDILEVEFGAIKPRTRVKVRSLLEKDPSRRFLFVLDDIYNKRVVETILSLGSTIRCIAVTRDPRKSGLAGHRSVLRNTFVKEVNDRHVLRLLESPLKERLGPNKVKALVPSCLGLPLIASLLRACFTSNEQDDWQRIGGHLLEALSKRPEDGITQAPEPHRTMTKLLNFILNKETAEMKWYFYSFLLFEYNQPIDAADAAVLWDLKEAEAAAICADLHSKALLIMVDSVESEKHIHLGFCVHHLIHKAALDTAKMTHFIDRDRSEIRSKYITTDVLYRAATRRRQLVLNRIFSDVDCAMLERLCRQRYGSHGQSFLHFLYNVKWKTIVFGVEHNQSAELLIDLINRLMRVRADIAKHLSQEDTMGDCALMKIVENKDDHTPEQTALKTLVESIGQKAICKIAALRQWTERSRNPADNTSLFMAALRCDYTEVENMLQSDPSAVSTKNKLGQTALMAAVGAGSLPIVRLIHRVGGAELDDTDFSGMTAVLTASSTGRADILAYLQENMAKVEVTNDAGRTPLMLASYGGHVDVVKFLLDSSFSDVNATDNEGVTALMLACVNGHNEVTQILLYNKADLHAVDKGGNNALISGAHGGSYEVVQQLLNNGAKPDSSNNQGTTPLMKAASQGHVEIIQLLLSKGAKINGTDDDGATALFYAIENGQFRTAQVLFGYGASINAAKKNGMTALMQGTLHCAVTTGLQFLLNNGALVDTADAEGTTALMIACREGKSDAADLLIACGASINLRSKDGNTALFLAAEQGHFDIVKLLYANKAQLNISRELDKATALMAASANGHRDIAEFLVANGSPPNFSDRAGKTALMKAAVNGHIDTVHCLLMSGANVNAIDNNGVSAVLLTAGIGNYEMVKTLLTNGAKVNVGDRHGVTPIIAAITNGHISVVELLQSHGADVNLRQRDGVSPLMLACRHGHYDIVQFLLAKRADVNVADEKGTTALMEASRKGHVDIVKLLLRTNVNVNAVDHDGASALFMATEFGHVDIVRKLHEHGALLNLRKKNGVTPLMEAAFSKNEALILFLQRHGAK